MGSGLISCRTREKDSVQSRAPEYESLPGLIRYHLDALFWAASGSTVINESDMRTACALLKLKRF
eukprot:scaffold11875_cov132-Isochrysis_galbana.AAC.7